MGVLADALGQFVDAGLDGEDVRHGAEPAQRRRAHRQFLHQMMQDALGRKIVKRLAVAGGAATGGLRHVVRRRHRRRIGQCLGAKQIAAVAGPVVMCAAPDFGGPVGGLAGVVE